MPSRSSALAERTTPGTSVAMSVGVSDASGATGIQADLKTFSVMGVYGTAAVTSVRAVNTRGVKGAQAIDGGAVRDQINAIATDFEVKASKVSGLADAATLEEVAQSMQRLNLFPIVVDPSFAAKGTEPVDDPDAIRVLCQRMLPLAALVTANPAEAARLLDRRDPIDDPYGARDAGAEIRRRYGVAACVITGFRRDNDHEGEAVDVLVNDEGQHELVGDWRPTDNTLGAGGVFSGAVTAALALGQPTAEALQTAKQVVSESIRQTTDLGQGASPVNVLAYADVD